MKTIRLPAGILLVIAGIVHVIMYTKAPDDPGMMDMLVFRRLSC